MLGSLIRKVAEATLGAPAKAVEVVIAAPAEAAKVAQAPAVKQFQSDHCIGGAYDQRAVASFRAFEQVHGAEAARTAQKDLDKRGDSGIAFEEGKPLYARGHASDPTGASKS